MTMTQRELSLHSQVTWSTIITLIIEIGLRTICKYDHSHKQSNQSSPSDHFPSSLRSIDPLNNCLNICICNCQQENHYNLYVQVTLHLLLYKKKKKRLHHWSCCITSTLADQLFIQLKRIISKRSTSNQTFKKVSIYPLSKKDHKELPCQMTLTYGSFSFSSSSLLNRIS